MGDTPHPIRSQKAQRPGDRKSTRLNSSHANISYAVFCLKKKTEHNKRLLFYWEITEILIVIATFRLNSTRITFAPYLTGHLDATISLTQHLTTPYTQSAT